MDCLGIKTWDSSTGIFVKMSLSRARLSRKLVDWILSTLVDSTTKKLSLTRDVPVELVMSRLGKSTEEWFESNKELLLFKVGESWWEEESWGLKKDRCGRSKNKCNQCCKR